MQKFDQEWYKLNKGKIDRAHKYFMEDNLQVEDYMAWDLIFDSSKEYAEFILGTQLA